MSDKNTEYKLLGAAVADTLKNYASTVVLINTDDMSAALIDVADNGECIVKNLYQGDAKPDFYQTAADRIGTVGSEELFVLCKEAKKSLKRYIKTDGASDEQLKGEVCCNNLLHIYEDGYKQSIEQVINATKAMTSDDVNIVLIGRLSAFYPAEHTVRTALTPMPFLPLERLCVDDSLCVANDDLIKKGQAVSERLERDKKRICHNIMLRHKRRSGADLVEGLLILAKKGDSFEVLKNPKYSDSIIVHALDPIVIQADSIPHTLAFPRTLFSTNGAMAKVQIALGIENDIPKLMIKSTDALVMLDIDKKIYSEEE